MIEIWGVGNRFRSDDSLAFRVCERIESQLNGAAKVFRYHGDLLNLIHKWDINTTVILIDAIQAGRPAGTLYFHSYQEIRVHLDKAMSTHNLGLSTLISMAENIEALPNRLYIAGIEAESFGLGEELSPRVLGAIEKLSQKILQFVATNTGASHA